MHPRNLVFLVPAALFVMITIIILAYFNYLLKKRIIESTVLGNQTVELLKTLSDRSMESLKWGLIFFFGGCGLVVLQFIPYDASESTVPYGIEALFLAMGFLTYYYFATKNK